MQSHPASYRDNAGFVFRENDIVYRYIHPRYDIHYQSLMNGGLYDELVKTGKLIAHDETMETERFGFAEGRVVLPQQIPFISYPYEWSFHMWQDAALLTLDIALRAHNKDMVLKDASPFNIQFHQGKPVFIDTLSFENYCEGEPWIAYRQFCECFLAPLLLMHYCHPDTAKIFSVYPNGIPMNILVTLLPNRSKWNLNTLLHVHLQASFSGKQKKEKKGDDNFSKQKLEILLKGLESYVKKCRPKKRKTSWDDYYTGTILGDDYLQIKTSLVRSYIEAFDYKTVIDLGANDGHFSLLFNEDKQVIALDADPNCIDELYLTSKKAGRKNILPLVNQLTTPSPALGWNSTERESITDRLKADLVLALALVHHLTIAHNIPLPLIANWLKPMGEYLLIEFVPKNDEKVRLLLAHRKDIFDQYGLEEFKSVFEEHYSILKEETIKNTERVLFLMKRRP